MAKVAVSKAIYAIDKPYDYLVPPEQEGQVLPGMRVAVPFGSGNRGSDGIVLSLERQEENTPTLKPVLSCLDDAPVLDEKGIQLALWMRERYFCTVSDAVKAMLPAGMYFALRDSVTLVPGLEPEQIWDLLSDAPAAARLAEMLCCWGGSGDMTQIHTAFGAKDPTPAIRVLLDRKIAVLETSAQRAVGDKTERLAVLNMPAEEAMELVASRRKRAPLRYAVTELLCTLGAASTKELCYFTGASPATLRSLEKSGILTLEKHEVLRRVRVEDVEPAGPVELNQEQEAAFRGLDRFCLRGEAGAALLRLTPAEGADPREAVFRACAGADLPILEMRRESLSLEQIFLELTSDASAAGQAGGRRRPFGRRDSAEPEPAPETAITEHGEEAEP